MNDKIVKTFILYTSTAVLSLIIIKYSSNPIIFNFTNILITAFICTVILSIAFLAKNLLYEKTINFSWLKENFNLSKKLIEYNTLLEKIIEASELNICVKDKTGKEVFCSKFFNTSYNNIDTKNKSNIAIENKIYKIIERKICSNNSKDELDLTILENITEDINEQQNKETSFTMIAHDLKTPVYALTQALELICSGGFGELNPTQKEVLELCYNSSTFAKYLVENILCAYKIGNNQIKLYFETFDLCQIIKTCKNEVSFLLKEKPLRINLNIPTTLTIYGDKNELQRVILNLLYNAVSYSKPNSEVDVNLNYDENYINFTISNESEYLSSKEINSILKKNFSLKNRYNKPGTGLGLYVASKIIEAHKAEMIIKSSSNNINTFGFKLKHKNNISAKSY